MDFKLWLFAIKHIGQTYDMAALVYDRMPEEEKKTLQEEYKNSMDITSNERKES